MVLSHQTGVRIPVALPAQIHSASLQGELLHIEPETQAGYGVHLGLDDGLVPHLDFDEPFEELLSLGGELPDNRLIEKARLDFDVEGPLEEPRFGLLRFGGRPV